MARPALGRMARPEDGRSPASRPPRPRSVPGGGRAGGPGPVRRPVSEVRGPGVQLRDLRAARPPRRGGRHGADVPVRPGRAARLRGARRPVRRRRGVDLPGLAVPDRPQRHRRAPAGASAADRRRSSTRPWSCPPPFDLEGEAITRDEAAAAWRAIDRLDDDRRRVVVLRFVHELSTAEIAAVLGRSEGAVRVLIHRALRSVAADLRRRRRGDAGGRPVRDDEVEALVVDRYLESLLARRPVRRCRRPGRSRWRRAGA